ncbi:MAG: DUF1552 domain-containing protein [Nannocystaceae bacterium]|nr:DUF1552 domain-containing protein [bacterium]
MNTPKRLGRRNFLMGASGAVLAIPALHSLLPSAARANIGDGVRRNFISWRITNGMFGHDWFPTDAAASGLSVVEPNVREMPLSDIAGPISTLLDTRFDDFRDRMNLLRHIDRLDTADHNRRTGLFGWGNVDGIDVASLPPSIDNLIAEHAFDIPSIPLNLGVRWSSTAASCSVTTTSAGEVVEQPGLHPAQAFQALFAEFDIDDVAAARRREQKRLLVDRALEHYTSVRNHPRLSAADRDTLDEHVEHMYTLEHQLSLAAADCSPPDDPEGIANSPEGVDARAQAAVDIAIAALRCEMTQVVNIYLDPDVLFTDELHGVAGGHHGASHNGDPASVQSIQNAHRWHMHYLTDFLTKLDAGQDIVNGGTILDNSLVLVNNEIGNQNGQSGTQPGDVDLNHGALDNQVLLIGSAGGRLRTGNYLDYRTDFTRNRWSQYIGTSYNWVLVTCMLAMGLEPETWEVDGEPGYGDMRGHQYNMTPLDQVVVGDLRSYLPRLQA